MSFLAAGLKHYSWACEQVLTKAAFLLKREGREADLLFELLERGVIRIALNLQEERADLRALMHRYRNRPHFAGGCLSGATFRTAHGCRGFHAGLGFSQLPPPREQGNSSADAGMNASSL